MPTFDLIVLEGGSAGCGGAPRDHIRFIAGYSVGF